MCAYIHSSFCHWFCILIPLSTTWEWTLFKIDFWMEMERWQLTAWQQLSFSQASGLRRTELSFTLSASLLPVSVRLTEYFPQCEEQSRSGRKIGKAGNFDMRSCFGAKTLFFIIVVIRPSSSRSLHWKAGLRNPEGSWRLSAQSCGVNRTFHLPPRDYGICSLIKGRAVVLTYWPMLQFNATHTHT